jgi:hypothetical protein
VILMSICNCCIHRALALQSYQSLLRASGSSRRRCVAPLAKRTLQLLHSSRTGPAVLSKLVASTRFLKAKMRCSTGKKDVAIAAFIAHWPCSPIKACCEQAVPQGKDALLHWQKGRCNCCIHRAIALQSVNTAIAKLPQSSCEQAVPQGKKDVVSCYFFNLLRKHVLLALAPSPARPIWRQCIFTAPLHSVHTRVKTRSETAVLTCVPTQRNTKGIRTGSMEGCHWLPRCKTPLSRPKSFDRCVLCLIAL